MAESPIIETKRLRIVPFSKEYLTPRYVGWLNDPAVMRFSEQRHKKHTLESCSQYWQSFSGSPHFFWAIIVTDRPLVHIGNMSANIDTANSVADVGILIGELTAWNKGYGLEAWQAICDYLLHSLHMRKVTAGTLAINQGMLSIMGKSGMNEDGRRIRQYIVEGVEVDVLYAAIFNNELQGSKQ